MKVKGVTGGEYEVMNYKTANELQMQGNHYRNKPIQPWDYIAANGLDYFQGNIVKYVTRFREKGGINDLMKAQHYLQKLIELEQQKSGDQE